MTPSSVGCSTIPSSATQPTPSTVKTTTTTTTIITPLTVQSLSCDFESSCKWINDGGNFDWIVINGSTSSSNFYGPNNDHTLDQSIGNMLIPNAAQDQADSSIASYNSPLINGTKCVEFFYYMLGPQVTINYFKTFYNKFLIFLIFHQ